MNDIKTIELNDERLLTTEQLAEQYGVSVKVIHDNFNNNRERFVQGKHFILLDGDDLKDFKSYTEDIGLPINKFARQLYLWKKPGASRHSKMIATDQAWDQFDLLEEVYFSVQPKLNTNKEMLKVLFNQEEQIEAITTDVNMLKGSMRISGTQQFNIQDAGKKKALSCIGGVDCASYPKMNRKVFAQLWRDFKRYFKLPRYSELPKKDYERGLEFINAWQPDTATRLEIEELNSQVNLDIK